MSLESFTNYDIALMHIHDELSKDELLFSAAINELEQLKSERPLDMTRLPQLIQQALQTIIDRSGSRNSTLYNLVYKLILDSSSHLWRNEDPRIYTIRILLHEVDFLKFQLYQNIKGYYNSNMVNYYLEAPNKETHPIKYMAYMLGTYDTEVSSSYASVHLILNFLVFLTETIQCYDYPDDTNPTSRNETSNQTISDLEKFCNVYTTFQTLYKTVISPFLLDMRKYNSLFIDIETRTSDVPEVTNKYKQRHKTEHLHRIKQFLIDIATFFRQIQSKEIHTRNKLLIQNIAFAIESMCGLYNPIESLFEQATPIMLEYYR